MKLLYISPRQNGRRGVALLTVLAVIAIITAAVLGFLILSKTQQVAAYSYKISSSNRMLVDTVVNLVEGEVNEATSYGTAFDWSSQPGAIRVYDNTGAISKIYRLYSAQTLTLTDVTKLNTSTTPAGSNDMPPTSWQSNPALWVDINAPANDASLNAHYPIFDAGKAANVDGFSVNTTPIQGATSTSVPMPVRWNYVLQNGEIIAPDATGTTVATFVNSKIHPSAADPIVGRIAFWTDDDTCKVNINTAGGDGITSATAPTAIADKTFWDTPHFSSADDVAFANIQPALGEYQRYPGHPATLALNNILNGLGWTLSPADFYGLLPRYSNGGSTGATVSVSTATSIPLKGTPQNRLYSSVSEMLFNNDRTVSVLNANDAATRQRIETANFFLTAHSRAPELTLSGQPRVSIWPVFDTTSSQARTPIDKLLAFAATNSTHPYYFTRVDPKSSTRDIALARNQLLLSYLDYFTSTAQPIPGYGGSFDTKYTQSGTRQILTEIFDYIRTINIADTTQAASISATQNTTAYAQPWDPSASSAPLGLYQVAPSVNTTWSTQGIGAFPRLNEAAIQFVALGRGATSNKTAIPVNAAEIAKGISATGDAALGSNSTMAIQAFLILSFINPAQMLIGDGTGNSAAIAPFVWVEVSGLNTGFKITGTNTYHSLFATVNSDDAMIDGANMTAYFLGATSNDYLQFNMMMNAQSGLSRTIGAGPIQLGALSPEAVFPFYGRIIPITIPATSPADDSSPGTMNFAGGTITVKLYDGSKLTTPPAVAHLIQTYTITFPGTTTTPQVFPIPSVVGPSVAATSPHGPTVGLGSAGGTDERWVHDTHTEGTDPNSMFIVGSDSGSPSTHKGDVVESMVLSPQWSDARVLATSTVPASAFVPAFSQTSTPAAFTYGFTYDDSPYYSNTSSFTPGKLANITGASYNPTPTTAPWMGYFPAVPPTLTSGVDTTGTKVNAKIADWDNGIAAYPDGPWINKADEGNLIPPAAPQGQPWIPYFTQGQGFTQAGTSFFSPNREVPSPMMFGSLPTGISATNPTPWQTLLFRPNPLHPGWTSPKDHLLADLFWMPVAEPYAISEPFSSAGKVNLNYQIQPFTYITRNTALRAVLNPQKVASVSPSAALTYKENNFNSGMNFTPGLSANSRVAVDVAQTLTQFQDKFDGTNTSGTNPSTSGDIFHSASQICEMYLVPQGSTDVPTFVSQWNDGTTYGLVGDNVRERPYANIYGQITTRSNTYTIHYTVQALKNAQSASLQNQWDENAGTALGEYRGSTSVERYIDPNQTLPDFAAAATVGGQTLESYYKWRVVENTQFAP